MESRIIILGMKGIFFCRRRKITKFDFFMFKDSLLAFSHSLTLPSSRLTSVSSSVRLLFPSIILVSSANRQKANNEEDL